MRPRQVQRVLDAQANPDIYNAADRLGEEAQATSPYGVGIDCHAQFIQVCVLRRIGNIVRRLEREFPTRWADLELAKEWAWSLCKEVEHGLTPEDLHYVLESTGTYHMPVVLAFQAKPHIINPQLAGATKRKTDVLDARLLATHCMCRLWPESFVVGVQAEQLRILLAMRSELSRNATRALNRIGNHLLRFGHTIGRDGSVADSLVRGAVEDMCRSVVPQHEAIHPQGLPLRVRTFFTTSYALYDQFSAMRLDFHKQTLAFVREHQWRTGVGSVPGKRLLDVLTTVPGVGEVTALHWLAVVVDPNRFTDARQVAAFCGCDPSLKVSAGKVTSYVKRKGNAKLHHSLKNVAAQLVRKHNEPIGQWGFSLQRRHAKGGWAKAINAVSRRVSCFLWHVHRTNAEFSYEQYRFYTIPDVIDCSISEMELGSRYEKTLLEAGLKRSNDVARAFMTSLPQQKGIGAGCLSKVKVWLDSNQVKREPTKGSEPTATLAQKLGSFFGERSAVVQDAPLKVKTGRPALPSSRTGSTLKVPSSTSMSSSKQKPVKRTRTTRSGSGSTCRSGRARSSVGVETQSCSTASVRTGCAVKSSKKRRVKRNAK